MAAPYGEEVPPVETASEASSDDADPPAPPQPPRASPKPSPPRSPMRSPMRSPARSPAASPAPSPRECPVGPRSPRVAPRAAASPRPGGKAPQARTPQRGTPSGSDDEQRTPAEAGNPKVLQRLGSTASKECKKQKVQALLQQFSDFAHGLHESTDQDLEQLKQEMMDCEAMVQTVLNREVEERVTRTNGLERRCEALEKALAAVQKEQAEEHGHTKQRIDYLENMFGAWADKHTRDVEALRRANEALGRELATFNEAHEQHLEVEESLDTAVKGLTSAAEQTAKALAAAKAKLDHMHEGVMQCEQHCASAESRSAALTDRLKECERRLESSINGCSKELEFLKGDHSDLSLHVKQKFAETHEMIIHSSSSHKANLDKHEDNHATLMARHDAQVRDVKSLKEEHAKHGQDLGLLRRHVEGALGELAHNTAQELKATRDEVDQILGLLAGVQRAWRPDRRGSKTASCRKARNSDEVGSPKTPKTPKTPKAGYEMSIDLMKHGVEPGRPHLL